eukprot:scaffold72087_cov55-Phaeocystis_antarctica.AAC.3
MSPTPCQLSSARGFCDCDSALRSQRLPVPEVSVQRRFRGFNILLTRPIYSRSRTHSIHSRVASSVSAQQPKPPTLTRRLATSTRPASPPPEAAEMSAAPAGMSAPPRMSATRLYPGISKTALPPGRSTCDSSSRKRGSSRATSHRQRWPKGRAQIGGVPVLRAQLRARREPTLSCKLEVSDGGARRRPMIIRGDRRHVTKVHCRLYGHCAAAAERVEQHLARPDLGEQQQQQRRRRAEARHVPRAARVLEVGTTRRLAEGRDRKLAPTHALSGAPLASEQQTARVMPVAQQALELDLIPVQVDRPLRRRAARDDAAAHGAHRVVAAEALELPPAARAARTERLDIPHAGGRKQVDSVLPMGRSADQVSHLCQHTVGYRRRPHAAVLVPAARRCEPIRGGDIGKHRLHNRRAL